MAALTSRLPNLSRDNISLQSLPLLWIIVTFPRAYGRGLYKKATKKDMDAVNPRSFPEQVAKDPALDEKTRGRILRAEGAISNGLENFPIVAAAVLAGNVAGLSPKMLNGLTLGYIASRVAYNVIYIWQDTYHKALLRPLAFYTGLGIWVTLFVKAGNVFKNAALGK